MSDKALVSSSLLTQGFGRGPDFSIYTGAMRPMLQNELPPEDADKPLVSMRGSSIIEDLQGDTMRLSALQDMATIPANLTFWLNHSYSLPQDAYGKLYGKPKIELQDKIADIWLVSEAFLSNPPAEKTYFLVKREGARFGCSVGCQVLEMSLADPRDPYSPIFIDHVYVVEFSIVGIPANQRCWVENAIKGVFTRSLAEGDGDKTLSLAPAFKGLFSKDFNSILRNVTSDGLRKDLEKAPSRDAPPHRILYDFTGIESEFILRDNKGDKPLSRNDVSALLQKSARPRVVEAAQVVDEQKSVSGKTDFPLMDIGTEWTGSKAEKQIFEWARDDNDEIVASKAKQCFLYFDPENSDKQSGYKMPFCYISGGSPKIVPLGVRAVANVLSGGMGGVSASGADKDGMKAKVKTMFGRINSQFKPDPEWQVPWEGEKAADVEMTKDAILDSDNGKDLVRQDLKEDTSMDKDKMPKASDVEVSADGSHDACTGLHIHAHKAYGAQGDDDLHEHEHAHDGDAHHGHSHEAEKDLGDAPIVEKQLDITPEPVSEETPEVTKAAEVETPAPAVAENPHNIVLLEAYNAIGKQLGFEPASLDKQKCMMGDMNMQEAIGLISQVDAHLDQADDLVDRLMSLYGIPDVDKMPDSDEAPALLPMASYSAEVSFLKSFDAFLKKEGKEISEKNRGIIAMMHDHAKSVHDMAAAMHPDACKCAGMVSQGTDVESARQDAQYQMADGLTRSMEALAQALEKFNVPDIEKNFQRMKSEESTLHKELANLKSNLNALKNMPLGRPTQLNRSIEGEASYDDLKVAVGQHVTLKDALKATELVALGGSQYRRWPAGAGVGLRPGLTSDQKSLMRPDDIIAYQDGGAAYVPVIDDPEA